VPEQKQTDLLGKLSGLSDEAVRRLQSAPGGDRAISAMNAMREGLDDLQRRMRGVDELEKRLTALEKKVDKLAKAAAQSTEHHASKPKQ
jgi:polyhydroxyalkanoate synthesis regulator phasin